LFYANIIEAFLYLFTEEEVVCLNLVCVLLLYRVGSGARVPRSVY